MSQCRDPKSVTLPASWRAVYLMAPFSAGQLALGLFSHSEQRAATRVTLYGLRHGKLDLLIRGNQTHTLATVNGSLTCEHLGDMGLRPFPQDLRSSHAVCQGAGPVMGQTVDWWKMPAERGDGSAAWLWFDRPHLGPFRLMFTQPQQSPPVLGQFTLSYRVSFETKEDADVDAALDACRNEGASPHHDTSLAALLQSMERSPNAFTAEIERLAPALQTTCPSTSFPEWDQSLGMTAFMTPPGVKDAPLPTEIAYDWTRQSQRTRMISRPKIEEALLAQGEGFSIVHSRTSAVSCAGGLPGTLRPDWPLKGGCSCEAMITAPSEMSSYTPVKILRCPMTPPRVVWSWFNGNRPLLFMETSAPEDKPEGVLVLTDYHAWTTTHPAQEEAFSMPPQCPRPGKPLPANEAGRGCGACHLDALASPLR